MADDKEPKVKPLSSLPESVKAVVKEAASMLQAVTPTPAMTDIDVEHSGQLPRQHTPANAPGGSDGMRRERSLVQEKPVPSVNEILADPKPYLPPPPPGHSQGHGLKR